MTCYRRQVKVLTVFFEEYDPERFASLYADVGPKLSQFFASPIVVALLEGSVKLRRPAVEAIEERLLEYAKDDVKNQRVRQLVGHMIRHLMEELGYEVDQPEVRLPSGVLFTCGARYRVAKNARRRRRRRSSEAGSEARQEGLHMTERPISTEQLARWRLEAEGLDKLAHHGSDRRARVAVVDVVVVLSLLDEVERLRGTAQTMAAAVRAVGRGGALSDETLRGWRGAAETEDAAGLARVAREMIISLMDELEWARGRLRQVDPP